MLLPVRRRPARPERRRIGAPERETVPAIERSRNIVLRKAARRLRGAARRRLNLFRIVRSLFHIRTKPHGKNATDENTTYPNHLTQWKEIENSLIEHPDMRGFPPSVLFVAHEQVRVLRQKRMKGKSLESAAAIAGMGVRTARKWESGGLAPGFASAPVVADLAGPVRGGAAAIDRIVHHSVIAEFEVSS